MPKLDLEAPQKGRIIVHLGSLEFEQEESASLSDSAPDADGWIYLNLLCNLAQLHIINVTQALSGAPYQSFIVRF